MLPFMLGTINFLLKLKHNEIILMLWPPSVDLKNNEVNCGDRGDYLMLSFSKSVGSTDKLNLTKLKFRSLLEDISIFVMCQEPPPP